MSDFIDDAWAHEGWGANGGQGHMTLATQTAGMPDNDAFLAADTMVRPTKSELQAITRISVRNVANEIGRVTSDSVPPKPAGNLRARSCWYFKSSIADWFKTTYQF